MCYPVIHRVAAAAHTLAAHGLKAHATHFTELHALISGPLSSYLWALVNTSAEPQVSTGLRGLISVSMGSRCRHPDAPLEHGHPWLHPLVPPMKMQASHTHTRTHTHTHTRAHAYQITRTRTVHVAF